MSILGPRWRPTFHPTLLYILFLFKYSTGNGYSLQYYRCVDLRPKPIKTPLFDRYVGFICMHTEEQIQTIVLSKYTNRCLLKPYNFQTLISVSTLTRFSSKLMSATNAVIWNRKSNTKAIVAYMANVFTAGMSDSAPVKYMRFILFRFFLVLS